MLQTVIHVQNQLGEGPCWDDRTQLLYWVDIYGHLIQRYDPATKVYTRFQMSEMVTSIWPTVSDRFVVTTSNGIALWQPGTETLTKIATVELGGVNMRLNESGVDAEGRIWFGCMEIDAADRQALGAKLFHMSPEGVVTVKDTGIGLANGIGWSSDQQTMYLVDSYQGIILAYTTSKSDASLSQRRTLIQVTEPGAAPDGLRVDADGNLWVALYNGAKVVQYSPQGQLLAEIAVPVAKPTCCVFAGTTFSDLYISTTQEGYPQSELTPESQMGDLFVTTVAAHGLPMNRFDDRFWW